MEYASWSETVIENLIREGIDPQLVRKIFNEEKKNSNLFMAMAISRR
ncbi:hypothetical protein ALQ31_01516 [Pseudomonas amygdali pv. morsprunorum]|uniref:Uncharacterized protein n=1 Tax=Pseudomonas syringae TaxID=317 RepID=A0A2K4WXG2_PSESX|nr:hypothetical protein ALQ31_01516 [Pseudomonas amygdali pv. morsprunorum]SOS40494.1 hypothetical protein CFBP3840_03456 [Pseudomonas syringae]SPD81609.1 hypothetical protein PSCFBP2116_02088 [Pseudomonas syringae]